MNFDTYTQNVKEETSSEDNTSYTESETDVVHLKTAREADGEIELYKDHEIKDEMVIGPVVLQRAAHSYSTGLSEGAPLLGKTKLDIEDDKTDQVKPQTEMKGNYSEEVASNVDLNKNTRTSTDMKTGEVKNKETTENFKQRKHTQTAKIIFICNDCGKYYTNKCALAAHIESHMPIKQYNNSTSYSWIYTSQKPYSCSVCERKFTRKYSFKRHLRISEEPYACSFCEYKCTAKSTITIHLRTHTGEKPHACFFCEYKCIQKNDLTRHLRTHTGKKSYSCYVCEYKSARKGHLKRHLWIHTDEKPYSCSACEYKCTQKTNFTRHLRIHTGEKPYSRSFSPQRKHIIQKHRNNVMEVMMNTNATPFRSHTDKGYNCCFCPNAFLDPADLKQHTIEQHVEAKNTAKRLSWPGRPNDTVKLDITSLYCVLCGGSISTIEQLTEHLRIAHDRKMFTDIKNLILPFKFDTKTLTCCICLEEFYNFSPLLKHMNSHYSNFECKICNSGFVTSQMLKAHSATHKTGTFDCDHCQKQFNTVSKKKTHERSVHTKTMMLKCGYCSEQFRYLTHKDKHLREVHGVMRQEFKCRSCDKTYAGQNYLRVHTKRYHLLEKPHQCESCNKAFYSSGELKFHMLKHTGARDFTCDVCDKSYSSKYKLKEHIMRKHLDFRRFKCKHCNHSFVYKFSLKRHMRTKHGKEV